MYDKHHLLLLAGICAFDLGALILVLFGLDWLGWSMMASAVILWLIVINLNPKT